MGLLKFFRLKMMKKGTDLFLNSKLEQLNKSEPFSAAAIWKLNHPKVFLLSRDLQDGVEGIFHRPVECTQIELRR